MVRRYGGFAHRKPVERATRNPAAGFRRGRGDRAQRNPSSMQLCAPPTGNQAKPDRPAPDAELHSPRSLLLIPEAIMIGRSSAMLLSVAAAVVLASDCLRAQCQQWQDAHSVMGTDGVVFATCAFDDGSGPALCVAGAFNRAGSGDIKNIARWNGTHWSPLGAVTNGAVKALVVFDDGSGPALYAGGEFTAVGSASVNHIARWNGQSWSSVGSGANDSVEALCVFDDGSGPALYAGGVFNTIGGVAANRIAKWDGAAWSPLGSGADGLVVGLAVFDDGSGPALFAGGTFQNAGGASANHVAKWNGSAWSPLGSGTNDNVIALNVFDDGSGAKLYAGGSFTTAGGVPANRFAGWNGSAWSALGSGFNATVTAITAVDLGSGAALYAGGDFTGAPGSGVAMWNGTSWTPLEFGISGGVHSLAGFDDGNGAALFIGGSFAYVSIGNFLVNSRSIVKWDGAHWAGVGGGTDNDVDSFAVFDDGTGPALFVGGKFQSAGSVSAKHIAKYQHGRFTPLGIGLGPESYPTITASSLAVFDDGSGSALYVGGTFVTAGGINSVGFARWNGSGWSSVSTAGVGGTFRGSGPMIVFDDGSGKSLFVCGEFFPSGSPSYLAIAKWNGSIWQAIGSFNLLPRALAVFDDGSGAALYAAGSFKYVGGADAEWFARWNGVSWTVLPGGASAFDLAAGINCMTVFDDGTGPALYAAGYFDSLGGVSMPAAVGKWNGAWSSVGQAAISNSSKIYAMRAFDDGSGSGPSLYVGGKIYAIGGVVMNGIARWSGTSWSPLPPGLLSWFSVNVFVDFDDSSGNGPDLWAGGAMISSDSTNSGSFAQWRACGQVGVPTCFGDGTTAACPCANNGLPGHGCDNSASSGGARIARSGSTSLAFDTLQLTSSGELANAFSVFLQGSHEIAPAPFGDGLRCAGGNLKRLFVKQASGGSVSAPQSGDLSVSARSAALGDTIVAASTRIYQVYYRDPSATFCPSPAGDTWNVSSGLRIEWLP
jgi:hypothetical protein